MTWKEFCIYQHDVVCNQKYGNNLPYSFHLEAVHAQFEKFKYLLSDDKNITVKKGDFIFKLSEVILAEKACYGHDLIEDARITYNNIVEKKNKILADIIFGCTESTGRDRDERHDDIYYNRLISNEISIFVKLCDIIANVLYSLLTNSSMYYKYSKEYFKFKVKTYTDRFDPMYIYLENLFQL